MGVRGQLSGLPPPLIGSSTIRSRERERAVGLGWCGRLVRRRGDGREPPLTRATSSADSVSASTWLGSCRSCNMGCTSSAPNMVTANTNPTDKVIHFSENTKDDKSNDEVTNCTDDGNRTIEKVLPPCDTLGESIQLARNNKSLLEIPHTHAEKDPYANGHVMDGDDTLNNDSQVEDKFSSLEDVVEKVVELYIADNAVNDTIILPENTTEQIKGVDQSSAKVEEILEETPEQIPSAETEPSELIEEKLEEAISPSQSTSSRATRWEALADIAAELPPSLAVDPVTGQIYALK